MVLAAFERVAELVGGSQQLDTKSKTELRIYASRRAPYSDFYRALAFGPYMFAVAH